MEARQNENSPPERLLDPRERQPYKSGQTIITRVLISETKTCESDADTDSP